MRKTNEKGERETEFTLDFGETAGKRKENSILSQIEEFRKPKLAKVESKRDSAEK